MYSAQFSAAKNTYIMGKKQLLHNENPQQKRANSSGQDSAVHLYLKDKEHSSKDSNVHILAREN